MSDVVQAVRFGEPCTFPAPKPGSPCFQAESSKPGAIHPASGLSVV